MNYCPHCGHKLNETYTLCPECSHRLNFANGFGVSHGTEIVPCAHCGGKGEIDVGGVFTVKKKLCPGCAGAGVQRV